MYRQIKKSTIKSLEGIFGPERVIFSGEEKEKYSRDESPGLKFMPELVLIPSSASQVAEAVKLASSEKFPLTARGGGTSLTGGPLPCMGGAVISFEKMNRIIDIDTSSRMARVEPGVITGDLDRAAAKYNLFYPVNPASVDSCTLGGNAATAAGGANTVKYGTTRNYLTGVEAVDGTGNIWRGGGNVVKNSTDQQLIQLAAGSEGTLSLFTSLVFRLVERPSGSVWIIAPFKDLKKIPPAAEKIFSLSIGPTMVELMDSETLKWCTEYTGEKIGPEGLSQLLIRFDFAPGNEGKDIILKAGESCMDSGAEDVLVAETAARQEKIWKIRSSIHDAIKETSGSLFEEDVVVPPANIGSLLEKARQLSGRSGLNVSLYGHLGDGNIHVNFTGKDAPPQKREKIKKELFSAVSKLGGKISGEHGIGITKKPFLKKSIDSSYLKLLKKVKKQFDPANILNPGKIF